MTVLSFECFIETPLDRENDRYAAAHNKERRRNSVGKKKHDFEKPSIFHNDNSCVCEE